MRRAQVVIVTIMMWGFFLTTPVSATNIQGLEWGVEVGDEFYFIFEFHYPEFSSTTPRDGIEVVYMKIGGLPEIINNITSYKQLYGWTYHFYWVNGSMIPSTSTYYPYFFMIFPIGNWSYLTDLYLEFHAILPDELIDTPSSWGFNSCYSWPGGEIKTKNEVSKLDGVSIHDYTKQKIEEAGRDDVYYKTHELTRINYSETTTTTIEPNYTLLIGSMTGIGGTSIVLTIWLMRRRK